MSDWDDAPGGLAALAAVGLAVCCGLPLLLGAGIAVGAVGAAMGSVAIVAAGAAVGTWGWRRHRQGQRSCTADGKKPEARPGWSTQTHDIPALAAEFTAAHPDRRSAGPGR